MNHLNGILTLLVFPNSRIKDYGIGIQPKYQDTVFRLSEKLDFKSYRSGAGLELVRHFVEAHGGKIRVESEGIGKDSTFFSISPESRKHI
jgi:signal transduction histidine kinase